MRIRPGAGPVAVALAVALLLSGCTGDEEPGSAATPPRTEPAGSPSPEPTASPATTVPVPLPEVSVPSPPPLPEMTLPPGPAPTDGTELPELPELVTVTGTVQAGVETGCLLLDGLLLIGGSPEVLQPGNRVTVTGRIDQTMVTFCQQGIPLVVTSAEEA